MNTRRKVRSLTTIIALGIAMFVWTSANAQDRHHDRNRINHDWSGAENYRDTYGKHNREWEHNNRYEQRDDRNYYAERYRSPYDHRGYKKRLNRKRHMAPWGNQRPLVFYNREGNFYFHRGVFYRWHDYYGYVRIHHPSEICFTSLPRGWKRVYIGRERVYQVRNLYFVRTSHGYRLTRPGRLMCYGY